MRDAMEAEFKMLNGEEVEFKSEGSQNQWADTRKNEVQFGYDADAAADSWWAEVGEREIGSLGKGQGTRVHGRL